MASAPATGNPLDNEPMPKVIERRGNAPTLAWYLASNWMGMVLLTMLAMGAFIYLVGLLELWRELAGKHVPASVTLLMNLAQTPTMLMRLLPFAILLGSIMWLNQMNRRYELVAMRASGLPARRFLFGPLMACLLVGFSALLVGNPVSSTLLKRYESWFNGIFPNTTRGLITAGGNIWLRQHTDDRDYFIYGRSVSSNGDNLGQATVFVFNNNGDFVRRMDAKQAVLQPGHWRMDSVFSIDPSQTIAYHDTLDLPTTLTPAQIQASFNPPDTLDVFELRAFIQTLKKSGFPTSHHAMAYESLLALPFMCMAMLLLAVPFGLRFARNRSTGMVLLAGLGMGFGFYLFGNIVAAYGLAGRLDVRLAAWLPALMAMLLAVALMLQLREE